MSIKNNNLTVAFLWYSKYDFTWIILITDTDLQSILIKKIILIILISCNPSLVLNHQFQSVSKWLYLLKPLLLFFFFSALLLIPLMDSTWEDIEQKDTSENELTKMVLMLPLPLKIWNMGMNTYQASSIKDRLKMQRLVLQELALLPCLED